MFLEIRGIKKIIWNRRQPRKCVERAGSEYRKRGILCLTGGRRGLVNQHY